MLFPGLTKHGHQQAVLGAVVGGLGWRAATSVALPANLAALILGAPKIRGMAEAAVKAGLVPEGLLERRLDLKVESVKAAYLNELNEVERVKAQDFLAKAVQAAEDAWTTVASGWRSATRAPRAN